MSMSNLKNIDRNLNRSNASVISNTGSVTSINSVGKKRRAPVPPAIKKVPEPISEETPSMIHLENNNNVTKPHRLEEIGRRVLPDLPVPKNKQNLVKPPARNIELDSVVPKPSPPAKDDPPPYTESAVEQPSDRPAPAPRSSLLEEAIFGFVDLLYVTNDYRGTVNVSSFHYIIVSNLRITCDDVL